MLLFLFTASAAFVTYSDVRVAPSPRTRWSTPVLSLGDAERDAAARRAARMAPGGTGGQPQTRSARTTASSARIEDGLARALVEFAKSAYAMELCRFCNVNPPEHGRVGGIFESLRMLNGGTLDVKLTMAVDHKHEELLGHLATHLRSKAPQHIERLQYEKAGGWGTTRTWII